MRQIKGDVIMTVRDIEIKLEDRMCYLKTKAIESAEPGLYDKAQYYNQKVLDLYEIMLNIDLLDKEDYLEQTGNWIEVFYSEF